MAKLAAVSQEFTFTGQVWRWKGDSPWHFVSLPENVADEVEDLSQGMTGGFGSVPVEVRAQDFTWQTSLFPDKASGTYMLPLKKQVREHVGCEEGSAITVTLRVRVG